MVPASAADSTVASDPTVEAELYLYYRMRPGPDLAARVEVMLSLQASQCERCPGLQARLLRRTDASREGQETWMEHYRWPGRGLQAGWADALDEVALPLLSDALQGERHREWFVALERPR